MAFTRVVLPTPGPTVTMSARLEWACRSAACWLGASSLPVLAWHQATALVHVDGRVVRLAGRKVLDSGGDTFLGPLQARQEYQLLVANLLLG